MPFVGDPPSGLRLKARHTFLSAIHCFFHVYEEPIGTYGFGVQRHILVAPNGKLGCDRRVDPDTAFIVGNDVCVDRSWCWDCALAVAKEQQRRLDDQPPQPILIREVL